jgi:hypothetical protein
MKLFNLAATALAAALILTGCATAGYKQADKTGAGMAEFREEILSAKAAIDNTMDSLDQVAATATTDPRKAFEQYSKSVKHLESVAAKAGKRGQAMKADGEAYFKKWEQEIAQVSNPEIRQLAEQRKARLQGAFTGIRQHAEPLKAQFDPWLSDLKDLEKYLGNDLTVTGVDAARNLITRSRWQGVEVQKAMDGLVAELNSIAATITPAKAAAK